MTVKQVLFIQLLLIFQIVFNEKPYILFVPMGANSHVSIQIEIAKHLISRGYKVNMATFEHFRNKVTKAGIPFVSFGTMPVSENTVDDYMRRGENAETPWELVSLVLPHFVKVYNATLVNLKKLLSHEKPTFIVTDIMCSDTQDLATELKIPYAITTVGLGFSGFQDQPYIPSMLLDHTSNDMKSFFVRFYETVIMPAMLIKTMFPFAQQMNDIRKNFGLPPAYDPLEKVNGHLTIVPIFFGFEYARKLPPYVVLVGGILPEYKNETSESDKALLDWLNQLKKDEFVVYIAFGTLVSVRPWQIQTIVEGISKHKNAKILFAIRKTVVENMNLPKFGDHVRFENWVNQRLILRHEKVKAFITHGGIQSILESIEALVPMIVLPFDSDQFGNSARVVDSGIGLRLKKTRFTADEVYEKVKRITTNSSFLEKLKHLNKMNKFYGGASKAADWIEYVLGTQHTNLLI